MDRKWKVLLAVGAGVILTKLVLEDSKPPATYRFKRGSHSLRRKMVRDSAVSQLV